MNFIKQNRICSMILALTIPLVLVLFEADTQCAQASQKSSEDILLEIMDLHTELVTNETFLAQAKMLGAYLEAAQPLEEAKKIKIYAKVLGILAKIKDSKVHIALSPDETESSIEDKNFEGEQAGKTIYEPGAALLEIFKIDTEKQEIPDLPVIRTYWRHDLDWAGDFPLPGRISEIGGRDSSYFAKFSFYYEAKQSGKYGFTILHNQSNACGLTIGGVDVVVAKPNASSAQGVCNLKKGFHRIEFGVGKPETLWIASNTGSFQVKILTPGAFDAVPLTKDMMLLKKE